MPRSRKLSLILGSAIGLILPALLFATTAPAAAEKVGSGTFGDEDIFLVEDFCDVPGLDVEGHLTFEIRFLERLVGPDSVLYFLTHRQSTLVWTNLDTGQTATEVQRGTTEKDLKITVNDNGTITIIQLATGGGQLYGDDGTLIAKGDGQVRFRVVIDYNGTLADASDDTLVSGPDLIFGSTGTNDDFCEAILEDWGIA